jgi:hypothetical protein
VGSGTLLLNLRATSHTSRLEPVAIWQNGILARWPDEILKISTLRHRPIHLRALNVPACRRTFLAPQDLNSYIPDLVTPDAANDWLTI